MIHIQASDDVMVAGVQVMILDEQGKVVENGEAIKGKGNWWEYVPAAAGKVTVEARDLARYQGHVEVLKTRLRKKYKLTTITEYRTHIKHAWNKR